MPPNWFIAKAMSNSVIVSILALMIGVSIEIFLVSFELKLGSRRERMSERHGTMRTSSKVRPLPLSLISFQLNVSVIWGLASKDFEQKLS
ncbi:hypothetical protein D3C87_1758120 [compost metagenome]